MKDNNPLNQMSAREQAKLADYVAKGNLGPQMGREAGTQPPANLPNIPTVTNDQTHELTANLRQARQDQAKALDEHTPSLDASDQSMGQRHDEDEIDVDMFARGDVSKAVAEFKSEKAEDVRREAAKQAGLPFARILGYPISPEVLAIVPQETARELGVVAYLKAGKKVRLGITDPTKKAAIQAIKELQENTGFIFLVSVIGDDSYRYALKLYDELPASREDASDVSISEESKSDFEKEIRSLQDLQAKIKDVPTTKLIDVLLTGAVSVGASDVHIEPTEHGILIRYRLDGVLHEVITFPQSVQNQLMSRLKFLAKLKLDISKMPQDGRFTITDAISGKAHEIDIRVATIPVQFGEAITMRLLDRETLSLSIDSLGLTGEPLQQVLRAIQRPQGVVLECGPTGSGKTTTLYALLNLLNDPGKKIITLEDPIEYRMDGIMQSQVAPEHGYDFGEGFRSVLRLDPDIVMVGEVRDAITAEMATQASLTGHIVLSTLHTNDAPTAIPRLIDLGVRPFLLSNAVNVVIAQRLVRKVCPDCASEARPDPAVLEAVKARLKQFPTVLESLPPEESWLYLTGRGCEKCNHTGFRGRVGIFEVLTPTGEIEQLAIEHAPAAKIKEVALKGGMITMEVDGLAKALTGVTTIDEVWRVARDI